MKQRILTALLAIPPVMVALMLPVSWPAALLAALLLSLGAAELARLGGDHPGAAIVPGLGAFAFGVLPLLAPGEVAVRDVLVSSSIGLALGVGAMLLMAKGKQSIFATILATLWLAAPMIGLILLHREKGWAILLAIVPIWIGDTAAIVLGKRHGKHHLAPSISPQKTWEGAAANLIGCIAAGGITSFFVGVPWPLGLACGVIAGVFGQAGDLLESAVKRAAGAKDSGSLFPGHGGVLDRLDSLLLPALPIAALLVLAG